MISHELPDQNRAYDLRLTAAELETNQGIPALDVWRGIKAGETSSVIIASGSPRNGRLAYLTGAPPISQLSLSQAGRLIANICGGQGVSEAIATYRERRRMWSALGDGGLSLEKARLVLAAAAYHQMQYGNTNIKLVVIGRDYNVADLSGFFFDKPGYLTSSDDNQKHLKRVGLESWVIAGTDREPIGPLDQYAALYRYSSPIITTNSLTILSARVGDLTKEDIGCLSKINGVMPASVTGQTSKSFMAISLFNMGGEVEKIIQKYLGSPIDAIGYLLYQIPGVVDLSRSPFREHLEVWRCDGQFAFSDYWQLGWDIYRKNGEWGPFPAGRCDEEDELVGISTWTLRRMLNENNEFFKVT